MHLFLPCVHPELDSYYVFFSFVLTALPSAKGGIKEQPLVFNSKVVSSGYSRAPRWVTVTFCSYRRIPSMA